jgi:hypothetical protein
MLPLYADVSFFVLAGLCLGTAVAVAAAQAVASAIVALLGAGRRRRLEDSQPGV